MTGGAGQEGKSSAVPGGRMGGYELLGELGRGGMGIVYRARQVGLGREVALKVLAPGPWAGPRERSRFRREAAAIAALRHPNIVTVYEIGEADGHAFLAMELIAGGSLAERTASGPLASNVAAEMVLAVAGAMAAAHAAGVLHRDLKPGNILVGGDGAPRVADFGLARMVGEYGDEPTLSGQVFGSPGYLPPEQADPSRGEVSFAADIYALGALLYHLLTGRAPFTGGTIAAVLGQVLEDPPVPPGRHVSSVSRDLEVICLKCLEKEPVRRYPSAAAVADDLRAFLERRPISARRVGGMERAVLWARRRPALAGWATLLLIVSATGLAAFTWQAAVNRRNLYAADLRLASQALEDGDLGRARELLAFHQPLAGKAGDFAWRLFRNRSAGDPRVVLGEHPWIVNAVAWSPDGRRLASGSVGSGTVEADIRLWDMGGTPPTSRVLARHGAREITWMSDGGSLFAARPDGAVVQLSIPEGRVLREFPGRSLALSGDGHRLLVCEGSPFFWDEEPGAGAVTLHELHPGGRVVSLGSSRLVAIAPAGHLAAVSDLRTSVRLLALPEGRETGRLQLVSPVWGLTFSPDAAWLVATGPGNEVQVWETAEARSETGAGLETGEGRKPRRLSGHLRGTWRSAFSPDGRWLATASSDQSVRLWETGTWQAAGVLHGHGSEVWCVAFRPDGNGLVSGGKDRSVIQWTMPLGRGEEEAVAASYQPIAVGPDGRAVATVASDDSWVTLVHDTRERGGGVRRIADCRPLAFTSDGAELLGVAPGFRWRTIRLAGGVRDQGESDSGRQLEHQADETEPYEWSTGGGTKRLAGLAEGGSVSVWDLGNGQRVARHELPVRRPFFVHLRSDGEWLAVTGGEPGFWAGPVGGGPLRRLTAHRDLGKWAAFSADGRWLATAAVDATVRLWRLPGLSEVAVLRGHPTEVSCVAFSPDGDVLVSSEEGIGLRFWHLPTLREMGVMSLPDAIPGLVFSPDGGSLAVMASHSRVRLLRAPAGL